MTKFEDLGLRPEILTAIAELGYDAPMPVQEQVIPFMLEQSGDLIALAQTGTGKTAAYPATPAPPQNEDQPRYPRHLRLPVRGFRTGKLPGTSPYPRESRSLKKPGRKASVFNDFCFQSGTLV